MCVVQGTESRVHLPPCPAAGKGQNVVDVVLIDEREALDAPLY
jgi:hypothetical protein